LIDQINAVAAVNRNTIVVIHSVGPVDMGWANNKNITGIFYAGAPGEQTGPSIVDVLWGDVNPSGRLPFSIDEVCSLGKPPSGTVTDDFWYKDEAFYGTEIIYSNMTDSPSVSYHY
jgi:beta-glucosidase